jgi:hypothetical protein
MVEIYLHPVECRRLECDAVRATRCHIPEDGILYSQRRENFKSYIVLTGWVL